MSGLDGIAASVAHFRERVLQDALNEATGAYWRKRAEDFRHVGTPECDEVAKACDNRARVSLLGGDVEEFYALLEAGDGK